MRGGLEHEIVVLETPVLPLRPIVEALRGELHAPAERIRVAQQRRIEKTLAPVPFEEPPAEPVLQPRDLPTHRSVGDIQGDAAAEKLVARAAASRARSASSGGSGDV